MTPERDFDILINDNIPSQATMRGVARYFRHVAAGLIARFGSRVVVLSSEAGDYGPARHVRSLRFRGSEQLGLHDKLAAVLVRRLRPRVVYSPWLSDVRTSAAKAFTVHDLIYEMFPQYRSRRLTPLRDLGRERRRCIEQAAALLAVSQNTAKDLASNYPGLDASRITVVYSGVAPFFFDGPPPGPILRPYFLYVGMRGGYKNFLRLLLAWGQSGLAENYDLRVISSAPFTVQEREIMREHRLENSVRLVANVGDAGLRDSYAGATAFVYPSEYEGFGLPILEAMASGTLVATSGVSSMPEVGGGAAFYFDPADVESIAGCLRRVADLPAEQRRQRVAEGIARARTFSWERCQQQTVAVIEGLL